MRRFGPELFLEERPSLRMFKVNHCGGQLCSSYFILEETQKRVSTKASARQTFTGYQEKQNKHLVQPSLVQELTATSLSPSQSSAKWLCLKNTGYLKRPFGRRKHVLNNCGVCSVFASKGKPRLHSSRTHAWVVCHLRSQQLKFPFSVHQ